MVNDDPSGEQPMSSGDRIRRQHRFTVTPEHLILDPRVSDRAFRLWCRLDRFAGENESAYPTRETLCIELDCSPASIDRATKELVEAGWLKRERMATGDRNLYTLVVAPERDVERLVKAARKEREEASAPRREKRRQERRDRKRTQSGKAADSGEPDTENAEATEGGRITGDATPEQEGRIMGDASPRITGEARGRITGDAQKEASPEGSISEGSSVPSLRSGTADAAEEDPAKALASQAHGIAHRFIAWLEEQTKAPIISKQRVFHALVKTYITPALEAGYSEDTVRWSLADLHEAMPHMGRWRETLAARHGGMPLTPLTAPRRGDIDWTLAFEQARQIDQQLGLDGTAGGPA